MAAHAIALFLLPLLLLGEAWACCEYTIRFGQEIQKWEFFKKKPLIPPPKKKYYRAPPETLPG